jgi:hypothetical protein
MRMLVRMKKMLEREGLREMEGSIT